MDAIWSNFYNGNKLRIRDYLARVPVFQNIGKNELLKLEKYIIRRKFMGNEIVFRQQEPGAGMYIIISGGVRIQLELEQDKCKELVVLGESDFFGEMSLLDESARSASAIAVGEEVELLSFFRGDLLKVMQEHPDIACKILWNIGEVLSTRLRKSNEQLNMCKKG